MRQCITVQQLLLIFFILCLSLEVVTWRPSGSVREAISHYYIGGGHQLRNPDTILSSRYDFKCSLIKFLKNYII